MGEPSEKRASRDEKIDHVQEGEYVEKQLPQSDAAVDYAGGAKKTDPEEIKLVRKLDWMIMVS